MNDLQLSLIIVGFFVVVGVVGFNRWQEQKHRQRLEPHFKSPAVDVLLTSQASSPGVRQEPTITKLPESPAELPPALSSDGIDGKLNYVINMEAAEAIATEHLKNVFNEQGFNRRLLWQGYNEDTQRWDPLSFPGRYQRICLAVPLVDHLGAINENELEEFYGLVKGVAEKGMAVIDLPDKPEALQRAKELDQFCMLTDVSVGINIIPASEAAFSVKKIAELALSFGMHQGRENEFQRLDDHGVAIYRLSISGFLNDTGTPMATHGITYLFDVPLVANGLDVFDEMLAYARVMAGNLPGLLVDDNRRVLTDAGIEKIRQQISEIYATMEEQEISPGSARALSLFS